MNQPVDIEAVITATRRAGQLVSEMRRNGLRNIQSKSSAIDLVTEADLASEAFLREELNKLFPAAGFWGEESNQQPDAEFFWLVDPIDGTVNYANGVAFYSVTVALYHADECLLGVTVEPPAGRIYWAAAGEGAFLREPGGDQRRLRANQVTGLERAFLTTGFPYHRAEKADNNLAEFAAFIRHSQGVRCMGSAALDLAHVASGAMAGYWEAWLNPWDAAAGVLLVREAGGLVTDYWGAPWQLSSATLVANNGNADLHQAMLAVIAQARAQLDQPNG
ncbi:MAG: inositol monophosphatase [Caldilineaceae bacterium]|nr:inositol monophosphatase [Caldilineaceae bacterium]